MTRNAELLGRVVAEGRAHGPRQVYADWWLEQADPRGEYVSTVLALEGRIDPARRKTFSKRIAALFDEHATAWTQQLRALGAQELRFARGFVEGVSLSEEVLASSLDALLALEPITELDVEVSSGNALVEAMQHDAFDRITSLRLRGDADRLGAALKGAVHVDGLEKLLLRTATDAALTAIFSNDSFHSVQWLSITSTEAGARGLSALARGCARLTTLFAARIGAGDAGVKLLLEGDGADRLQQLALSGNGITDEGLKAIAASPRLANLERLELSENELDSLAALNSPATLPALKYLDATRMNVSRHPALDARLRTGLRT